MTHAFDSLLDIKNASPLIHIPNESWTTELGSCYNPLSARATVFARLRYVLPYYSLFWSFDILKIYFFIIRNCYTLHICFRIIVYYKYWIISICNFEKMNVLHYPTIYFISSMYVLLKNKYSSNWGFELTTIR